MPSLQGHSRGIGAHPTSSLLQGTRIRRRTQGTAATAKSNSARGDSVQPLAQATSGGDRRGQVGAASGHGGHATCPYDSPASSSASASTSMVWLTSSRTLGEPRLHRLRDSLRRFATIISDRSRETTRALLDRSRLVGRWRSKPEARGALRCWRCWARSLRRGTRPRVPRRKAPSAVREARLHTDRDERETQVTAVRG